MSDPSQSNEPGARELIALPEALRALPQIGPTMSAWAQIAAKLESRESGIGLRRQDAEANSEAGPGGKPHERLVNRESEKQRDASSRRRAWRYALPAALAAGVIFAVVATSLLHKPANRQPGTVAMTEPTATKAAADASFVHNAAKDTNSHVNSTSDAIAALQIRSSELERWLHDTGKVSAPQSAQDLAASAEMQDMIALIDVQLQSPDTSEVLPLWQRRVSLLEDLTTLRYSSNVHRFEAGLAQLDAPGGGAIPASWRN